MLEMLRQLNLRTYFCQLRASVLDVWCKKRALVDDAGVLEPRWGHTIDQK
jgi:hypothetical protein